MLHLVSCDKSVNISKCDRTEQDTIGDGRKFCSFWIQIGDLDDLVVVADSDRFMRENEEEEREAQQVYSREEDHQMKNMREHDDGCL